MKHFFTERWNFSLQTAKSSQPIASTLSTINAEALCGGEQILFSQSPASSSPSSPSPSTSSSVSGVSYELSLSRPGTSCSYVSPASPAPSVVQESRASKRRGDDLLSSHLETKKLKNNEVSRKSRLKRKERQYNQVEHIKQLEQNNRQLTQKVAELERLRDLLRSYSSKVTFMVTTVK
jgi:Basic region leucine zipper